jgi:tetratricopeptide (TPR) repeat protein
LETISVIVPTQPEGRYFSACLSSVLKSSYQNLEVIVIDAGGVDDHAAELMETDDRVQVFPHPGQSLAAAWNRGIEVSTGPMIAFLHPKDLSGRMRLELQVNRLEDYTEPAMSFCGMTFIDEDGAFLKGVHLTHAYQGERFLANLYHANQIGSISAVLLNRNIFEKIGVFDESLLHHEDYDLWLRIANQLPVDYLDLPLVRYRLLPQYSGLVGYLEHAEEVRRILSKHDLGDIARVLALNMESEELFRLSLGVVLSRRGEYDEAIKNFMKVLELNPVNEDVRFYLGNHHYGQNNLEEAIQWYLENLNLYPEHAETRNNLGVLLYKRGQVSGSRQEFQKAQQIKQDYQDPVFNLQCLQAKTADQALRITLAAAQITRNITSPARVG